MQDDIKSVDFVSGWFGVYNVPMAGTAVAHTLIDCHVLQFGHYNPEKTDT